MLGFTDMQYSSKTDIKYPSLTELYRYIVMYTVCILYDLYPMTLPNFIEGHGPKVNVALYPTILTRFIFKIIKFNLSFS